MLNVQTLLEPVSEASPAGEDLCYDPERQQIEEAFDGGSDGEGGVDWRATIERIAAQSGRTKDLWLAIYMIRAGARSGSLETVEAGCEYLAGLFENYWDTMHPTLDEYGFQGRKGPCESLTRIGEFLGPLRRTPLIVHPRLGSFSGEDIERFAGEGESADGYGMFRAAVANVPEDEIRETVARLDRIRDAIRRADQVLTANAGDETGTNFAPTYQAIDTIRRGLAPFTGEEVVAIIAEEVSETGHSAGEPQTRPGGVSGRIDSREDVVRTLDQLIDYYRRREPGSPVPVALVRAKKWVGMDFLAVLRDISPESLDEVRKILVSGSDTSEDDDDN